MSQKVEGRRAIISNIIDESSKVGILKSHHTEVGLGERNFSKYHITSQM